MHDEALEAALEDVDVRVSVRGRDREEGVHNTWDRNGSSRGVFTTPDTATFRQRGIRCFIT